MNTVNPLVQEADFLVRLSFDPAVIASQHLEVLDLPAVLDFNHQDFLAYFGACCSCQELPKKETVQTSFYTFQPEKGLTTNELEDYNRQVLMALAEAEVFYSHKMKNVSEDAWKLEVFVAPCFQAMYQQFKIAEMELLSENLRLPEKADPYTGEAQIVLDIDHEILKEEVQPSSKKKIEDAIQLFKKTVTDYVHDNINFCDTQIERKELEGDCEGFTRISISLLRREDEDINDHEFMLNILSARYDLFTFFEEHTEAISFAIHVKDHLSELFTTVVNLSYVEDEILQKQNAPTQPN